MAQSIPITVLGGYLGAGKTTILNLVLATADRRLGVIVNDFGELGVDAALVGEAAGDDGLIDLPNGCVCCTLGTDLGVALEALADREPAIDQIIIEASGVADPQSLAAWGTVPGFAPGGVVVVAAADSIRRQADDRYIGSEVRRQLVGADLLLLSKTDLLDDESVAGVIAWLQSLTTTSVSVTPGRGAADASIADLVLSPGLVERGPDGRLADGHHAADGHHDADGHHAADWHHDAAYRRWVWRPPPGAEPVARDGIDRFVESLPDSVLRAKGMLSGVLIQVVGNRRSVETSPSLSDTIDGVVAIGVAEQLDSTELDQLARTHLG